MPHDDDLALARRIAGGDESAFLAMVESVGPSLKRLARTMVKSDAVAQEVVQETWTAVLEGLAGFEGRSALRTWACRILFHTAKKRTAREARSVPMSSLGDGEEPDVDPARFSEHGFWTAPPSPLGDGQSPEGLALRREVRELVQKTLEALPEAQRLVVTMRDVEGWESEDVCNVLELTETNQRVLLHRGRARLRAVLETYLAGGGV